MITLPPPPKVFVNLEKATTIRLVLYEGGNARLTSGQHVDPLDDAYWNAAMNGIESLLMTLAGAGVDFDDDKIIEAVESAIESCSNNEDHLKE